MGPICQLTLAGAPTYSYRNLNGGSYGNDSSRNGSTETSVTELDREGRITELSRILGGIDITESQRAAAVDMLDERNIYE